MTKMIEVPADEWEEILDRLAWLDALEAAGVVSLGIFTIVETLLRQKSTEPFLFALGGRSWHT